MHRSLLSRIEFVSVLVLLTMAFSGPGWALTPREETSALDDKILPRSGGVIGLRPTSTAELAPTDPLRVAWERFAQIRPGSWRAWVDSRSGLPKLVVGAGIPWFAGAGNDLPARPAPRLSDLEALSRTFLEDHPDLLGRWPDQMVLDLDASGALSDRTWQVTFRQEVDGVRVDAARYDFHISHGNLVAFGTDRWAPVRTAAAPTLSTAAARARLDKYLGVATAEIADELKPPRLWLLPADPRGRDGAEWTGPRGEGYDHVLVWRFVFAIPGEPPTWVGEVDAHTGGIVAFYDDTRYERILGGVHPIANDGDCANDGCEEPGFPMPFADYTEDGGAVQFTGDFGLYTCGTAGAIVETSLDAQYVRVQDNCGPISETGVCDEALDLGTSPGTNCQVASGASPGNSRASRDSFFHLNRVKQKGRGFLPSNAWLKGVLNDNVNINSTCNAYWNGSVNFYRAGGGCGNTGENQAVIVHEWGHGMDQNDGGGYDNPSEAYADIVAFFESRESCIGRGFRPAQNCSGYGDACLDCTGIRDMDWDKREQHTPATPSGFLQNNCGGGSGPCSKETHCEGYVAGETLWDLANRDLPAEGLEADTAWQVAERLFYLSRDGSGGNAYNCSIPSSDGCGTNSWFHKLRLVDDDDGNLDNGTPHAGAIFAAFDRHDIACGQASDSMNQSTSSCPTLDAPTLSAKALTNAAELNWTEVADAASYVVLRTELGCDRAQMSVGEVDPPTLTFTDDDLANEFAVFYRVHALGANRACVGAVSNCIEVSPQPLAGKVRLDQPAYGCSNRIGIQVVDANVGSPTVSVELWSDTEPQPETAQLTETSPDSGKFVGEIFTTSDSPSPDGLLSTTNEDTITVEYVDADDGAGGFNQPRHDTSLSDCVFPLISDVHHQDVTDAQARITWTTDEVSDSVVLWGETVPLDRTSTGNPSTTSHDVTLTGLQECTQYLYEVQSTDGAGNTASDDEGGQYHRFETLGDLGAGLQNCHEGKVLLERYVVGCSDTLSVRVVDIDLNLSPTQADTATATVSSSTETDPETILLTETGPNTSQFTGSIQTAPGPAQNGDGVLQSANGDLLTATYHDADDGTGLAGTSFATADADCIGPVVTAVEVTDLTEESAIVRWTTSESTTGRVEWGDGPGLGNVVTDDTWSTTHAVLLKPLTDCDRFFFRVFSTDTYGNEALADAAGAPFELNAYTIPGLVFRDGFETDTGWTLQGEWEMLAPEGRGSSPGDPNQAFSGSRVLGHDLTGLGANPGDYEPGADEQAISPTINASGMSNLVLRFRRWLNVERPAAATIRVKDKNTWYTVWHSHNWPLGITESSWSDQTVDISAYADGNRNLQIYFGQVGGTPTKAGWNVDRLVIKDGSLPDVDACGECGGAPTFAGLGSATDLDACGGTGVQLDWEAAPAWGTGRSGTFSVYRDTLPGFTPSDSTRIATGLAETGYTDAAAPPDTSVYYLVRAESDETCSDGPNNGGVTEANERYVQASDDTDQVVPGDLGNTLRLDPVNDAHVRLSWQAVPNAARYHVYRADAPEGPFQRIAEVTDTMHEDRDEMGDGTSRYYKVVAADACGREGP